MFAACDFTSFMYHVIALCHYVSHRTEPSRLTVDALEEAVALGTKPRQTDDVT